MKKKKRVPVTHVCNPRYSGDGNLEGCGSRPAQGNRIVHETLP
jgi:hypothetical protein